MSDQPRRKDVAPSPRGWGMRFRLPTLLGVVCGIALGLAGYANYRASRTPWELAGGMIGWSQSAIESSLGPASEVVEGVVPDEHAHRIPPGPTGTFRTMSYRTFDGQFVVWYKLDEDGQFRCAQSKWPWKNRYY